MVCGMLSGYDLEQRMNNFWLSIFADQVRPIMLMAYRNPRRAAGIAHV